MAFCKNCGNQISDGAAFCANCGTPVDNTQPTPQQNTQQAYQQPIQPTVMNSNGAVLPSDKSLAWLSYIPWAPVFLVPLFVRKNSEYCQYHVKQGATLWAVGVVYEILKAITLAIISVIFPGIFYTHSAVYHIFDIIFSAGSIFLFVLAIIGIVNAATGKKKEILFIGKIPWIAMLIDKIYAAINK